MSRHFLAETDFTGTEIARIFALARQLKRERGVNSPQPLAGQTWAMLFYKNSTRTRISFEVGIRELGGNPLFLDKNQMQLSRGESIADTAKILSRYVHGLVIRAYEHAVIEEFASEGSIPVVNALTDLLHPCQIYSDAFSMAERWAGPEGDLVAALRGRRIVFLGDTACNMANSWILAAHIFGLDLVLGGPPDFRPGREIENLCGELEIAPPFTFTSDAREAVRGADVVYTDVWVSMGREEETAARIKKMSPYAVTPELMAEAAPEALFMHCLPAHPGMEVKEEVLNSPASIIFDQAENRLHMQKAILATLAGLRS